MDSITCLNNFPLIVAKHDGWSLKNIAMQQGHQIILSGKAYKLKIILLCLGVLCSVSSLNPAALKVLGKTFEKPKTP